MKEKNIHADHRKRLRKRFREEGLNNFELHNLLELMLFYAIPMRDVNPQAHALVESFGSLTGVLDAPYDELIKVDGISEGCATFIKLIPQLCSLYYEEKVADAKLSPDNITDYLAQRLIAKYLTESNEVVYVACLDNRLRLLCLERLCEGTSDFVSILTRRIVEIAIRYDASNVVLAHNHPNGMAIPSRRDCQTTRQIYSALNSVSIKLLDHLVVARNEYTSMAAVGMVGQNTIDLLRSGHSLGEEEPELFPEDFDWREPIDDLL